MMGAYKTSMGENGPIQDVSFVTFLVSHPQTPHPRRQPLPPTLTRRNTRPVPLLRQI